MSQEEDSGFAQAKRVLSSGASDLALLFGNGINLAGGAGSGVGWPELMERLIGFVSKQSPDPEAMKKRLRRLTALGPEGQSAASLPETFDVIAASMSWPARGRAGDSPEAQLQAQVLRLLGEMRPGDSHKVVVAWAARQSVPILTTNYDHCIQDAYGGRGCQRRRFGTSRWNSDYYPWDRYYAPSEISDPVSGFAVWHIHGDRDYRRSIRAGLDQYMGMVQHLRGLVSPVAKEVLHGPEGSEPSTKSAPAFHRAPWLRVAVGKRLWIQGLALRADEVSARWLLIQRFRFWRRYRPNECYESGWYVHGPVAITDRLDLERRVFFESVGLKTIEITKPDDTYHNLFGEL
jgi:hypothetical protein